ncbi:MAG TPA: DUF2760 domain-containing protein [Candidatus Rifleibacterium sp.]|nr:DUF2760 domain-containing protein [Candidatus Rifleibacterium sp.]HPT45812.1 DUF2760 domain-containing protein [Candidatus Rifleibacterium sp.]
MKKAAAFLILLALLATTGGTVYLQQREASPKLSDLQPVFENLKTLVPEAMQLPVTAGFASFMALVFLLTLLVLFERRPATQPAIAVDNSAELDLLKNKIADAENAQTNLKKQISDLDADNGNLKVQLEKLRASAIDSHELAAARELAAELEKNLANAAKNRDQLIAEQQKAINEVKTAVESRNQLQREVEALIQKVEKTEADAKNYRKDSEKTAGQLKTAQADLEKKIGEISELRQQVESLTGDLKSAQANMKGGKAAIPPAAYQILYLFQKEGRLIDLLSEDISELDDETLGGAIRPIHEGCRRLLADRLILERVLNEEEGSIVTLDEIDPEAIKLSGRVPATGPYKGELIHRGWRLKECNLPELVDGWKGNVIAPAEVEIS